MALLEVRGVTKIFGPLTALSGIDLTVEEGEFHGLIGPNGSGKSTAMKCIAGAEAPSQGTIAFAGLDITDATPAERARAGLSLKFQITSVLAALTVYDNVLLALQARTPVAGLILSRTRRALDGKVLHILERFHLADRAAEPAAALSHGQQRSARDRHGACPRAEAAAAGRAHRRHDLEERRITGELLQPIKHRCSLVIVEHDLDFITTSATCSPCSTRARWSATAAHAHIQNSRKVQEVYLSRA